MATLNTGEFEKIVITDAGRAMISGARDNNTITFTRIALGDGQIESPDDIFTLTKIKHECLSMPIVSKKDITDGQIRLEFRLNNSEIETGFTFREIGIMAHMADGIEQLYAYTYAKDPTQIYDKNTPIQERIIYADIVVGNSENINIILDLSNTYARMQDIADHNTDPTAHKTGIAGNAATSTKALQDTKGQQIDTTYIKSITASNATITATKGNGATSNITINNVAHATNADKATNATNADTVDGKHAADLRIQTNFLASQGGAGHGYSFQNDGSFDTGMFSNSDGDLYFMRNGTKTALAELAKLASPAFTGTPTAPTQGTGDNSTRVATTAFVKNNFIEILKKVYPVGAIYTSTVSTNPATLFGFGTWEQIQGRFLLGVSSSHGAGTTGGAETVTLTTAQLPAHNHSGSTGSAGSHNHSASSSNVNISGTFGTGATTPNIFFKGDTSGCFYNTGTTGNDGTNTPHYTQNDRTQKIGFNNTHSHTITVNSNGAHTHSVSIGKTGSGQAHTNMPPYIAVYIWKRKA